MKTGSQALKFLITSQEGNHMTNANKLVKRTVVFLICVCHSLLSGLDAYYPGTVPPEPVLCADTFPFSSPPSPFGAEKTSFLAFAQCGNKLFLAEGNHDQANQLYEIDPDGTITKLTNGYDPLSSNARDTRSLAFAQCGDELFLAEGNYEQENRLYEINCDGTITELTNRSNPFSLYNNKTQSLAFTQRGDKLFLAEGNGFQPNRLYEIDCDYGTITELTDGYNPFSSSSSDTYSLAFAQCGNKLFLAEGMRNKQTVFMK